MKNPPPRPGQFNLPNKSNIVADQSLREEQKPMEAMKYLEDNKQIKEEELSLKKIDYNNISSGSQTMINTVNKAKNLLGVFEVQNLEI